MESQPGSALMDTIVVFRHDVNKRAKSSPSNPSQNSFMQQNESNASRTRSLRGRSPSGRMSRWPCNDYLKGTCTISFCSKWHPPECLFYKSENGCRFGEKCFMRIARLMNSQAKGLQRMVTKSAVAMLKITRQLGCVSQDMEPPKSSSTLRKSSYIRKPIRCVKFTKAVVRLANIRDQNPSFGIDLPR